MGTTNRISTLYKRYNVQKINADGSIALTTGNLYHILARFGTG